jgi:uncharacterized protein YbjT (DUF2867 family)
MRYPDYGLEVTMRIAVAGGSGTVGRYVVESARAAGHEAVMLGRSVGVDLRDDTGVATALAGVEVIIDTTNSGTTKRSAATEFFTDVTRRLQRIGGACAVSRLITLSIVGIDRIPVYGYYEAKLAQERAAQAGPIPATIVRATQFHEFPAQVLSRTRLGPIALMPVMRVQPIAARAAAAILVEAATTRPPEGIMEIGGPAPADLTSLARDTLRHVGRHVAVVPLRLSGAAGRAMRKGALLPGSDGRLQGPTFAEWLATDDARTVRF